MSEEKPSVDGAVAVDKANQADVLDDEDMSSLEELEITEVEKKDLEGSLPDSIGKTMKNPATIIIDTPKKRSPKKKTQNVIKQEEKKDDDNLLSPVWATAKKKGGKKKKKKKGGKLMQRHSAFFPHGKKGKFAGTTMVLGRLKQMAKESQAEFSVVGRGMAGLEDMKEILDNRHVWYGLLKVQIGSGNFMRTKNIFINFLGEKCTAMKKGRAVRLRPFAEKALGYSHASVTFHSRDECTYEEFWIQVGNIFASDDLNIKKKGWSWEKARIEYEKKMAKKKKEIEVAKLNKPIKPKKKLNKVAEILSILREDMGWVNWVLFKPTKRKLVLFNPNSYGDGSIYRMRLLLQQKAQDRVLYGLIRMAFGVQPYRRTHYVMFHWVGEKTKIMQRGKWNSLVEPMAGMLCPFNITVQITRLEDMTVEDIILRVKKNVVVDGIEDEGKDIEEVLLKQFKEALEEEEKKNAAKKKVLKSDMEEKEEEEKEAGAIAMTVTEVVSLVSNEKEETNWVLIAPPGHERTIVRRQRRIQSCKTGI